MRKGLERLQGMMMLELTLEESVQNNQVKQGQEKSIPEGGNSMVLGGVGRGT